MRIHSNFFGAHNHAHQSSRHHKSNHIALSFDASKSKRKKKASANSWIADAHRNRDIDSREDVVTRAVEGAERDESYDFPAIHVGPYEEIVSGVGVSVPKWDQIEVPGRDYANELCGALESLEAMIDDKVLIKQAEATASLKLATSDEPSIAERGATDLRAQNIPLKQLVCQDGDLAQTVDDAAQGLKNMIFGVTGCDGREVIEYLADWDGGSYYSSTYESLDTIEVMLRKQLKMKDDLRTSISIDSCDYTIDSDLSMSQCASLHDEIEVSANDFKASIETRDSAAESKFLFVANAPDIELDCSTVGSVMTEVQTNVAVSKMQSVVEDTIQDLKCLQVNVVSQKSMNSLGDNEDVSVKTETSDKDAEVKSEQVHEPKSNAGKKATTKNAVLVSFFRLVKSKQVKSKDEAAIDNDDITSLQEESDLGGLNQPKESIADNVGLVPMASKDGVPVQLEVTMSESSPKETSVVVGNDQLDNGMTINPAGSVTKCNGRNIAFNGADSSSAEKQVETYEMCEPNIIQMKRSEDSKILIEMKMSEDSRRSCSSKNSKKSLNHSVEVEAHPIESDENVLGITVSAEYPEIVFEMKLSDDKSCSSKTSTSGKCAAAAAGDPTLFTPSKETYDSSFSFECEQVPVHPDKIESGCMESNNQNAPLSSQPELKSLSSDRDEPQDAQVDCAAVKLAEGNLDVVDNASQWAEDIDWDSFISDGITGIKSTSNAKPTSALTPMSEKIIKPPSKMSMVKSFLGKARTKRHSDKLGGKHVTFSS